MIARLLASVVALAAGVVAAVLALGLLQ